MPDRLSPHFLLAALLVTSFTWIGLLSLWAATSPRHWFLRTALVLALLAPLLFIPAHDLYIAILLPVCAVSAYTVFLRALRLRRIERLAKRTGEPLREPPSARYQFSMRSLLLLTAVLAVSIVIATRLEFQSTETIPVWLVLGASISCAALAAVVVVRTKESRWFRAMMCLSLFVTSLPWVAGIGGFATTWFSVSFLGFLDDTSTPSIGSQKTFWLAAALAADFLLIAGIMLMRSAFGWPRIDIAELAPPAAPPARRGRRLLACLFLLAIATPSVVFVVKMLQPLPAVNNSLPSPNGYDELVRLGGRMSGSGISGLLSADVVDLVRLDAIVPTYEKDYVAIRKALDLPFVIPVYYDETRDIDTNAFGAIRTVGRVLNAKAGMLRRAGNLEESLECYRQTLQLARSACGNGLLIHSLISLAVEGTAYAGIYDSIDLLDSSQCKWILERLVDHDARHQSLEEIQERELIWCIKIHGWPMRAAFVLNNLSSRGTTSNAIGAAGYFRQQTALHLLIVELAVRAYQLDHGHPPAALTDLVPDYLAALPNDPFAADAEPLQYKVTDKRFLVWSVGHDHKNNDGAPLPVETSGAIKEDGPGDMTLKELYPPDPPAENANVPRDGTPGTDPPDLSPDPPSNN